MTVAAFTCTTIYFKTESLFMHRLIRIPFQSINSYGKIPVLFESVKCITETVNSIWYQHVIIVRKT